MSECFASGVEDDGYIFGLFVAYEFIEDIDKPKDSRCVDSFRVYSRIFQKSIVRAVYDGVCVEQEDFVVGRLYSSHKCLLFVKYFFDVLKQFLLYFVDVEAFAELFFHRCYAPVGESAGIYPAEIAQVGIDVQSKAVHRNVSAALDADGAYLAGLRRQCGIYPYASPLGVVPTLDVVIAKQPYDSLFETCDVLPQTYAETLEVEYGVAYDLSEAVIRNVSSAVGAVDGDSAVVDEHIASVAALADGIHVRMFTENEIILCRQLVLFIIDLSVENLLLPPPSLSIVYRAPICEDNVFHRRVMFF